MADEAFAWSVDPIAPKDSEYWRIRESYLTYLRGTFPLLFAVPPEFCTPTELEFIDQRPLPRLDDSDG